MYNFIYYFIRYTIVRNLNKLFKPKNLLLIAVIVLMFVWVLNTESKAAYYGDFTNSDPNNLLILQYESVCQDFINRLDSAKNDYRANYNGVISDIKKGWLGYYIYYGNDNGLSSVNGTTYDNSIINIVFFDLSDLDLNTTPYDSYFTIDNVDVKTFKCVRRYTLDSDNVLTYQGVLATIYVPSGLFNYQTTTIGSYILNSGEQQTNQIINAINEQTNIISQQNEYLQAEPTEQDFSTSDLPSDTTTDITQNGINNIFTMFYNTFTRQATNEDYIEINVPFTSKRFYIPYNYTANFVPSALKSLISMFWYFAASLFIIKDILNKIQHIKSGDMENMQNDNIKGDLL